MEEPRALPAILFEPDGYRTDGEKLMGRQAAGNGFLRAAIAASAGRPIYGYTPTEKSGQAFAATVAEIDGKARPQWLQPVRSDLLARIGNLYSPGPNIADLASQRLHAGPHAWSITGVTHTTASHGAMDAISSMLSAPVMPWDALVCTSQSVLSTVRIVLEAQRDYLRWRFGTSNLPLTVPQLPVIPLGVHCGDFEIDPQARRLARQALAIEEDEVVALFVGRLSFHAKAHPHPMYASLQATARATGKRIVLIQCGWFANKAIENTFRTAAAQTCPDVRCIFTDGRASLGRRNSWASADVFMSLSDNIQETFGLSPVEAMSAGLPVVVTDWDGYRDTVRDGIDGFRIPTWMPAAGAGESLARVHELGIENYDMYCGLACQHVSVDMSVLVEKLKSLVLNAELRQSMGESGKRHAKEQFDWAVVFRRYQDLWSELDKLRPKEALRAPRTAAARLDPFLAFGHYPSQHVVPSTRVLARAGDGPAEYVRLSAHLLFSYASRVLPSAQVVEKLWPAVAAQNGATVRDLAQLAQAGEADVARAVTVLAKMGLVDLSNPK